MEVTLILNDAYFSRYMVNCMTTYDVLLRCVSWKSGRKIEVVLEGNSDSVEQYMWGIGAVKVGYSQWEMVSKL